ncbi:hypothetical protein U9M48_014819 [Paspalum notatum var. saurae]|uniref:Uncharacterized protein n=1 Tax=Paspalum notatum var. saurae TaxID=547442 RepID=A0AAQ3T2S3_PASNO
MTQEMTDPRIKKGKQCLAVEESDKENGALQRLDGLNEKKMALQTSTPEDEDETLLEFILGGPFTALIAFGVPASVCKEPTTQELGKSIERWPSMNHNATGCRYLMSTWGNEQRPSDYTT